MPAEVDLDERRRAAAAVAVDRLGDQLLAGAALAGDQDRGVGRRDPPDELQDAQQARVASRRAAEVVARVELLARGRRLAGAPGARRRERRARSAPSAGPAALVHGFVTKSAAPAFMPATASAIEPHAVIRMTGSAGRRARMRAQQVEPLVAGRRAARSSCPGGRGRTPRASSRARASRRRRRAREAVARLLQDEGQRGRHRRVVVDDQDHAPVRTMRDLFVVQRLRRA